MAIETVVPLRIARRLKQYGWSTPTHYVWARIGSKWSAMPDSVCEWFSGEDGVTRYYAPSAEELLRELPEYLDDKCGRRDLYITRICGLWRVAYRSHLNRQWPRFSEETLVEAAAKLFIATRDRVGV